MADGSIARDCDTLPDLDMAKKQVVGLQGKRQTQETKPLANDLKYLYI